MSLEPEGGSRTCAPTGPVVCTGKLIETVPKGKWAGHGCTGELG